MTNEEILSQLKEELKESEDKLFGLLEKQEAEVKAHGETTSETAKKIAAAEKSFGQIQSDLKSQQEEQAETLRKEWKEDGDKIRERIDELEKEMQRPGWNGGDDPEKAKSLGEQFVELEQFQEITGRAASQKTPLKFGMDVQRFPHGEQKASLLTTAATRLVMPQRVDMVDAQLRRPRIRDLIPVTGTTANAIEFVQEIGFAADGAVGGTQTQGAAAPVAEGAAKPEAQLELELKSENVNVIAHWLPASRQILDDAPRVRSFIDRRLLYGLEFVEETQILYGDGTGANLQGITTETGVQTYTESTDGASGDTLIDSIRKSMTLSHVAEYEPTGVVVNPAQWETIQLLKGTDDHYIWLRVADGTEQRFFAVPVVVTNAITAATALVGSFALGAEIFDREDGAIRVSDSHSDFFTKNLVAILAEERLAQVVYRPDAFVDITLDGPPL